jgi:hypothetical protein
MGGGERGFGRLQLLSQLGFSINGVLKGLLGSMTGSFSLAKDRSTTDRAVFSLGNASCIAASCVVNATVQRVSWNQQKG